MAISNLKADQILEVIRKLRAAGVSPTPELIDQYFHIQAARQINEEIERELFTRPPQPEIRNTPVSEELPREQFLLKLLRMTTSSNDGEALTAIRKVNTLLTDNGWDWDKLIAGKIKIVPNPFVGLGTPHRAEPRVTPTPGPIHTTPTPPPPPPPRRAQYQGLKVTGLGVNKFADHCYCCGIEVVATAGFFFKREDYNLNAARTNPRSAFSVVCSSCEGNKLIWDQPAQPIRKRGKASINDLA